MIGDSYDRQRSGELTPVRHHDYHLRNMMQLEAKSVRSRSDVRASVDEKLGHGEGMSPGEAWKLLSGAERVEWILGELWYGLSDRYHIWIQSYAERDLDAPKYVACLAHAAQELDPEIAGLMSWTAERARGVRAGERGEALMSLVPLVWDQAMDRAGPVFEALVERWPESVELADLEPAAPIARAGATAAEVGCRFPGVAIGFTEDALPSCELVAPSPGLALETALLGLWRHGVSDDELETFYASAGDAGDRLPELLSVWVSFDGATGAPSPDSLDKFRRSLDPIASILGIESSQGSVLHRVKSERLQGLFEQLEPYGAFLIAPDESANFLIKFRSALRMDPVALFVESGDIETDEDVQLVVNAVWSGTIVVMGGDAPTAARVLEELARHG